MNRYIAKKIGSKSSLSLIWSGRRVSNSRPQPWQGCALPTELLPQKSWRREPESNRPTRICNPVHNRFAIAPRLPYDRYRKKQKAKRLSVKNGAAEESRTLDLNLGKVALYQLSYCRKNECALYSLGTTCQRFDLNFEDWPGTRSDFLVLFNEIRPRHAHVIPHRPQRQDGRNINQQSSQRMDVNTGYGFVIEQ